MERKIKKMSDYLYYKPLIHKFLADARDKYKDNLVSVIVFGSVARGESREGIRVKEGKHGQEMVLSFKPDYKFGELISIE